MQEKSAENSINAVSIILVTYNQLEYTQRCVQSIRETVPREMYELIVVDNASTDGTREWLNCQEDIRCILNSENQGFPAACNQGAGIAMAGNDIFLLNNDTVVFDNSVTNLCQALREEHTGAVGAVSNSAGGYQALRGMSYDSLEEWAEYAKENNVYDSSRHERRTRLIGFALMIRRTLWDEIGGLDENYGLGNFEDDDVCMQILYRGYHLKVCKDTFIYHAGGASFGKLNQERGDFKREALMRQNLDYFEKKWQIDWKRCWCNDDKHRVIELIKRHPCARFSVLDVGCGCGEAMMELESKFPQCTCYGIEKNPAAVRLAKSVPRVVYQEGNIEEIDNPFDQAFDYILLAGTPEYMRNLPETLMHLREWLAPGGACLLCVKNSRHLSDVYALLHQDDLAGRDWQMRECVFTLAEIREIIQACYFHEEQGYADVKRELPEQEIQWLEALCCVDPTIKKDEMLQYRYVFLCRKQQGVTGKTRERL